MKLVKFVPAIAATLVLAACSTAGNVISSATDAVSSAASATTNAVSNAASATTNAVSNAASATTNAVSNVATSAKDAVTGTVSKTTEMLPTRNKSVVYSCSNKTTVTATYAFHNEEAKGANLKVGKTAINGFVVNPELSQRLDSATFTSGNYILSVSKDLAYSTAEKAEMVMLTKQGKQMDTIVAKNCSIDAKATARLNK